jgi:succinate dehydrogenase / fumarate reductase, cytochrome b subunit
MADVNRGNRPLSPFMIGPYYRPQITSVLSILHRLTGMGLAMGGVGVVWWLLAAATDARYFRTIDGLWTTWVGNFAWICILWAFCYHLLNGIRHLMWDTGRGLDIPMVTRSGQAVVAGSVVLTIIVLIAA